MLSPLTPHRSPHTSGAPAGCEISYLASATEYHMLIAFTDHYGAKSDFGDALVVTTPASPRKEKKKKAPAKKVCGCRRRM